MSRSSVPVRELLDDLRDVETISPQQVDHAWRRFSHRQARRRRWVVGAWCTAAAFAVATMLLMIPSWKALVLQTSPQTVPSEAVQSAEPRREHETDASPSRPRAVRSPNRTSPAANEQVHGVEPAPSVEPADSADSADSAGVADLAPTKQRRPKDTAEDRGSQAGVETSEPPQSPRSAASLAAELSLLDDAERAMQNEDLDEAERLVRAHREQFPDGSMSAERQTLERRLHQSRAADARAAAPR